MERIDLKNHFLLLQVIFFLLAIPSFFFQKKVFGIIPFIDLQFVTLYFPDRQNQLIQKIPVVGYQQKCAAIAGKIFLQPG